MFTGIIKETAKVCKLTKKANLFRLEVESRLVYEQSDVSDSVAVNGACLTICEKNNSKLYFDATSSTVADTNIKFFKNKETVNLEPALKVGERLGGHFVLGHTDSLLKVKRIIDKRGYCQMEVFLPKKGREYLIEKGSIALDGVSLTIKKVLSNSFTLDIIPFTYEHTNLKYKKPGSWLNTEFDYLLKKKAY